MTLNEGYTMQNETSTQMGRDISEVIKSMQESFLSIRLLVEKK